jgi:hypothetical protein
MRLFTLRPSILYMYRGGRHKVCSQSHRLYALMGGGVPQSGGWDYRGSVGHAGLGPSLSLLVKRHMA